jgi:hypothetical protein
MARTLILGVLLAACTVENPGFQADASLDRTSDERARSDSAASDRSARRPEARPDQIVSCKPSSFLGCKSSTEMLACNTDGTGTVVVDCTPMLCDPVKQQCSTCTKTAYHQDADNDGYGDPASKQQACTMPAGFVENALDCDDGDPSAHPGQSQFFAAPSKGKQSYDYNCSGAEEREFPSLASCAMGPLGCSGHGWVGAVPGCGAAGTWGQCVKQGIPPGCAVSTSSKTQRCR